MGREVTVHTAAERQLEARSRLRSILDPDQTGMSQEDLSKRLAVMRAPGSAPALLRAELTYLASVALRPESSVGRTGKRPRYVEVVVLGDGAHPRTAARPTPDPTLDGSVLDASTGERTTPFRALPTTSETHTPSVRRDVPTACASPENDTRSTP